MRRLAAALLLIAGCAKHEPPPWITSVRVTGPDPHHGILGLSERPDLPPLGPHLSDAFASRRTMWQVRQEAVTHHWSRWWHFIPAATNVLGFTRKTLDRDILDQDAERIEAFFADRGWRDVEVDYSLGPPSLWISRLFKADERDRSVEVHFHVDVGQRYVLDEVTLAGDPIDVSLPEEISWGLQDEERLRETLQEAAETEGHGRAEVTLVQETDHGSTSVVATVDRGPVVRFGSLSFTGNEYLSDRALRRTVGMAVASDRLWDPVGIERLERRLLRLPGVAAVEVEKGDGEGAVPLEVTITERESDEFVPTAEIIGRPGTFTLIGGGTWIRQHVGRANSRTLVHAAGGYRHIWRKVWGGDSGPAASAGLGLDASLDPTATLSLHNWVGAEMDQWHGYHYLSGDAEMGPRWARGPVELWAGYRGTGFWAFPFPAQRETFYSFFEEGNTGNGPLERRYWLHQLTVHVEHDSRSHPVNPRHGIRWTLDGIPWGRVEGARLQRLETDLDTFWPTPLEIMTLRARVGAGWLDVDGDDVGVLLGHRLYTGGPYVVRGWVDRGILPPGSTWEPGQPRIGGNVMTHATLEPRFHVHPHVIVTPFVDAGSTWEDPADVTFDTLRWSAGGGARFPLVIGEAHLLFAWQASDPLQDSGEPPMRIHLTLEGGM